MMKIIMMIIIIMVKYIKKNNYVFILIYERWRLVFEMQLLTCHYHNFYQTLNKWYGLIIWWKKVYILLLMKDETTGNSFFKEFFFLNLTSICNPLDYNRPKHLLTSYQIIKLLYIKVLNKLKTSIFNTNTYTNFSWLYWLSLIEKGSWKSQLIVKKLW